MTILTSTNLLRNAEKERIRKCVVIACNNFTSREGSHQIKSIDREIDERIALIFSILGLFSGQFEGMTVIHKTAKRKLIKILRSITLT